MPDETIGTVGEVAPETVAPKPTSQSTDDFAASIMADVAKAEAGTLQVVRDPTTGRFTRQETAPAPAVAAPPAPSPTPEAPAASFKVGDQEFTTEQVREAIGLLAQRDEFQRRAQEIEQYEQGLRQTAAQIEQQKQAAEELARQNQIMREVMEKDPDLFQRVMSSEAFQGGEEAAPAAPAGLSPEDARKVVREEMEKVSQEWTEKQQTQGFFNTLATQVKGGVDQANLGDLSELVRAWVGMRLEIDRMGGKIGPKSNPAQVLATIQNYTKEGIARATGALEKYVHSKFSAAKAATAGLPAAARVAATGLPQNPAKPLPGRASMDDFVNDIMRQVNEVQAGAASLGGM